MRPPVNYAIAVYLRRKYAEARELLARTTADPERYQHDALMRIVTANADTTYGRQHGFRKIRTVQEYRAAVPINSYEELRPYVDRIADGTDLHGLTADPVEMFTNTSGTTNKSKLVPVTASGRLAERRVKDAWLALLVHDHPSILQ